VVETVNRSAIHFPVLPIPAVYLDDTSFVTIGTGIRVWPAKRLRKISRQPLDMVGTEAMAERMRNHLIVHHPPMPGSSQTPHALHPTSRLEDALHSLIMTIAPGLCKPLATNPYRQSPIH